MKLIDTHSHLYTEEFDTDREETFLRAVDAGVEQMLLPAIDSETHAAMFAFSRSHPDRLTPMMGLHPTSVNDNPRWREELALVEHYLAKKPEGITRWAAVGEIGLDFYWSQDFVKEQLEAFEYQIELSLKYDLPIAVHTRNAWTETRELMRKFKGRGVRGVFHAFADSQESYEDLKTLGNFVFGIGGVVTFKKSNVAEVVRQMSINDIVLETDCPYLTPVPYRGKRNESAYVRYVCEKVAELKGMTADEVGEITSRNARRMFWNNTEK